MIYYTADLHFGNYNIIKYENRPFTTVEDMNEGLIYRWNKRVKDKDDVYVLGDFAFTGTHLSKEKLNNIVDRLNGKKHLIVGNHDKFITNKYFNEKLWEEIVPYKEIKDNIKIDGKLIQKDLILCHYPIESWNCQHYGSIHLHGHLHSKPTILNQVNRYNVGIDLWNYEPVTLQEIVDREGYYEKS